MQVQGLLRSLGIPSHVGQHPSYADFTVVTMLRYLSVLDKSQLFQRVVAMDTKFADLWFACKVWVRTFGSQEYAILNSVMTWARERAILGIMLTFDLGR
jgi:hypothetical protein